MENRKEPVKKMKRPKSATRYPKRTNTYVVAFAVQEPSVDDVAKITTSKRTPENSVINNESISAAGSATSTKTFTISTANDLCHPPIPTISEVKIDIYDSNQYGDTEKKSPQTNNYDEVDNKMADEQPKIIFNASKSMKRCKEHHQSLRKKPKRYKRVVKFKSIHFKYKNSKNVIIRRLEKYYIKAKMNNTNSGQLKKIYSNTISKVVSRSRVLRKVLAKENLLAGTDQMWVSDISRLNENDSGSLESGVLFPTRTSSSYGSQSTLVNNSSFSSKSDDLYSIKTVNSVVPMSPPYKTDVSVAVAVAFSSVKTSNGYDRNIIPNHEESMDKGNETSTDTIQVSGMELTSQAPSGDSSNKTLSATEKNGSNETLTGLETKPSNMVSDDDTFIIGKASTESNKSSNHSEYESTSMSETMIVLDSIEPNEINNNVSEKVTLLDTVIHLGYYPEMTPSTSSGANFDDSVEDVTVKNNLTKAKKEILMTPNHLSKNVLKKSFDAESKEQHNNISLPNEVAIKAILKHSGKSQKKTCAEEVKVNNLPLDMIEIWDRMSLVIDLAVKRLEETITEKIIREVRRSLSIIALKNSNELPKSDVYITKSQEIKSEKCVHKEVFVNKNSRSNNHQAHQCDLVKNQLIDQLMLKLNIEGPNTLPKQQISLKSLKKPQIIRDYFEILKHPVNVCDVEVGKGDMVTVSTGTGQQLSEKFHSVKRLTNLLSSPLAFLRENLLVITSVPTFFIILFCLYGIVTLVIKPY